MKKFVFLLGLVGLCLSPTVAQSHYTIAGKVIDADNGEGLPFCSVVIKNSGTGATTDTDGNFSITTATQPDSVVATYVGYTNMTLAAQYGVPYQELTFRLEAAQLDLNEVVIIAGENPANAIVRNIIKNKDKNSVKGLDNYRVEMYERVELDLINIDTNLQKSRLMKPFEFVWSYFDSTSDERPFLPMYLSEQLFDNYYVNNQPLKSVLKAQKTSGSENTSLTDFISKIYENYNTYNNWIYIMDKGFASPFAELGLFYYEYYIQDSAFIDNQWSYKLKFKPKRRQENTFYGDFWVADTSFAIQRLNMRMSPEVNINLVNRVIIFEENTYQNGRWLPAKQKLVIDYTLTKKTPAMIGRKTLTYRDYKINESTTALQYLRQDPEEIDPEAIAKDEQFWQQNRHEQLTKSEQTVYSLVDSLKNVPAYKTYADALYTIVSGYKEFGNVEIGPYFNIYNSNPVEGHRFSMGARTSQQFSQQYRFGGTVAYGTKDNRWKYSAFFKWRIKSRPLTIYGISAKSDVEFSSDNSEEIGLGEASLIGGIYRRPILPKILHISERKMFIERWWKRGWSGRLTLMHRHLDPYGGVNGNGNGFNYAYLPDIESPSRIDTTITDFEAIVKVRYAFKEKYVDGMFERSTLGSKYPIIELQYSKGFSGIMSGQYDYHKLTLAFQHYFFLNPLGWTSYRFKVGKVWGTAPFLLLEVPHGNETYFYNSSAYNGMNRFEFATDAYASLHVVHHFDGYFLNKVPLLRKLQWREVIGFKAFMGTMSAANLAHNALNLYDPSNLDTYTGFRVPSRRPYVEMMAGIENIFKVLRVDAVWRLSYLDNPQAQHINLRVGLDFFF